MELAIKWQPKVSEGLENLGVSGLINEKKVLWAIIYIPIYLLGHTL